MSIHARFEKLRSLIISWRWRATLRWLVVAIGFTFGSLGLLYVFVHTLRLHLGVATLLVAEIATILRFFVTNLWVFDQTTSSAKGLWQFHCANAGGFAIWWCISNLLPRYGVHYMVAATFGTAGSMGFNVFTSFFWIWRKGQSANTNSVVILDGE